MSLQVPLIITPKKKAVNIIESSTTLEFNSSMSFSEINKRIERLGKYIPHDVTVTLQFADGTYTVDEALNIIGFEGGGKIEIFGNASDNTRQLSKNVVFQVSGDTPNYILHILSNVVGIYVKYIRFNRYSLTNPWRYASFFSWMCAGYGWVEYCSFDFSDANHGRAVFVAGPSFFHVVQCYFRYAVVAVSAYHNAYITVSDSESDSSKPYHGLEANVFGKIRDTGSVHVQGSSQNHCTDLGGQIVTG